jgi:hypothetical protein
MRERMSQREFLYWSRYYGVKHQKQELERLRAGG